MMNDYVGRNLGARPTSTQAIEIIFEDDHGIGMAIPDGLKCSARMGLPHECGPDACAFRRGEA